MDTPMPPEQAQDAFRQSRRATGYLLLAFLASFMPVPFNAVAFLPLTASLVASARCYGALREASAPRNARWWTISGMAITAMLGVSLALPYIFWGAAAPYRDCLEGANTKAAVTACDNRFDDGQHSFLADLSG
ncbi:hypothetical protein G9U51_12535 [Calidifontibacter sp. DB0510]|uniref:Uncharacterized protein n=1 Tax=Metallococcus carri TaxID=1656884 RepID=A0A967B6S7_9MICO|nr:hypothetical protein [Metallococcus carri]NHN56607.1 hypothetical protein [Metallococcus carri]NOP38906.1 hypothetical protein [Calidifontibacter sp. DB2511S]